MRTIGCIASVALLFLAACQNPPPVDEPVVTAPDNRALRPSTRTFGYSDADVEAMREKLKTIQYPVARGETVRRLAVELPPYSSLQIADYSTNDANLAAVHRRTAPLNGRYELVVVEHQHIARDKSITITEQSAEIRRIAP